MPKDLTEDIKHTACNMTEKLVSYRLVNKLDQSGLYFVGCAVRTEDHDVNVLWPYPCSYN